MSRILVVEDDQMLRDAMVTLLSRRGHAVVSAGSGNEAIRVLRTDAVVDLIISDYYMPDGDGRQLLRYVRARDQEVPVFILVTGQADATLDDLKALGVQRMLVKPVPIRELVAVVAEFAPH